MELYLNWIINIFPNISCFIHITKKLMKSWTLTTLENLLTVTLDIPEVAHKSCLSHWCLHFIYQAQPHWSFYSSNGTSSFLLQSLSTFLSFAWSIIFTNLPYANSCLLARSHFKHHFFRVPGHSIWKIFPPTLSSFIHIHACCSKLNYWPWPSSVLGSTPFSLTRVAVLLGKGDYSDILKVVLISKFEKTFKLSGPSLS